MAKNDKQQVAVENEVVAECTHPQHTINQTKIYVPAGHKFEHTCPGCGQVTITIYGPNILFKGKSNAKKAR